MTDTYSNHARQPDLERYALHELADPDLTLVEEHLLVCETCRQIVAELDVFVPLIRGSGRRHVSAAFTHLTDDGPVRLEIRALPDTTWAARFWGESMEGTAVFESAPEAYDYLRTAFADMYPDHLCEAGCGSEE